MTTLPPISLTLAETAQEHAAAPAWVLGLVMVNLLLTLGVAVFLAMWARRDTTADRLSDTQQQLVLSKIEALDATVKASIARHEADIAELIEKVTALAERLAVAEATARQAAEQQRRIDGQIQDLYRRFDALAAAKGAGGGGHG